MKKVHEVVAEVIDPHVFVNVVYLKIVKEKGLWCIGHTYMENGSLVAIGTTVKD